MKITIIRRITQASVLLLLVLIPILNLKGITFITGSLYSLAFGPIWITDPLSGLQTIMASLSLDVVLLLSMLIPVALAFVFGRVFCGWMCPQNSISELVDYVSGKFKLKRLANPPLSSTPRYIILVGLIALAPLLGFPVANLISAPGIISVQITKYFYEGVVGFEIGLIGLIIISELFIVRRLWCNYICPVGSLLGVFRSNRTMKVVYAEDPEHICGKCYACADVCRLGLNPMGEKIYPLCHNCGACVAACEKMQGKSSRPLKFRF